MKKALIATSVASMIDQFNIPDILLLQQLGYEVDVAANFDSPGSITKERAEKLLERLCAMGVGVINTPVPRSITALGGMLRSYRMLKRLGKEKKYDLVHCHSPIGGAITRLAFRKARAGGTRVIYTAHGFHFFEGAPLKNRLIFYPVEKLCSRYTDVLITINREDYQAAKEKLNAGRVEYIPGVGIDTARFSDRADAREKRAELGIGEESRVILSVGELNENKNHRAVIKALANLNSDVCYVVAGKGALLDELRSLAKELGVSDRVYLLGYREDVCALYGAADLFVHVSYREGLPVSVMEAMASGLPVVASSIRGNVDLIDENGGALVSPDDTEGLTAAIREILSDREKQEKMGAHNREASKKYSTATVGEMLKEIYG